MENIVEGLVGGGSSILPVVLVSGMNVIISTFLYRAHPAGASVTFGAGISIIVGIAGGIVGGVLADSYTDSVYNGIKYGTILSNIVGWAVILSIKYS
jgi:hypothetical protein